MFSILFSSHFQKTLASTNVARLVRLVYYYKLVLTIFMAYIDGNNICARIIIATSH